MAAEEGQSRTLISLGAALAGRVVVGPALLAVVMRAIAAYAYSAAGPGESTTDLAWDGHAAIYELGDQLAESPRFEKESSIVTADVDLGRIRQERMRNNGFADCALVEGERADRFRKVTFALDAPAELRPGLEQAADRADARCNPLRGRQARAQDDELGGSFLTGPKTTSSNSRP